MNWILPQLQALKKLTKNNNIVNLKDPSDPAFDFNSLYDSLKLKSYRLRLVACSSALYRHWVNVVH